MIVGKPDYIIEKKGYKIPVELKTGYCSNPKSNHIYQLAAYCYLVEENYSNFVPYGMLIYNNYLEFKIPFNPKVRFKLENIINNIRLSLKYKHISRNHNDSNKCTNCSMRKHCTYKII
jgi:CRISPR-associated exonuclease Cas4